MCAIFLTVYEIFANQIKYQKFDVKIEGQGEKRDLRHSTENVLFHITVFLQEICYVKKYVYANFGHTHTHFDAYTPTHTYTHTKMVVGHG